MPETMTRAPELIEIIHRFARHRPRLKAVLPEDLVKMKASLDKTHLNDKAGGATDFDLLFGIGVILSHREEGVTMGELSRALGVPLSTATRIVDWLVSSAYAARLPDTDDRRVVRVVLTPSGLAIYRTANDFLRRRVEKLIRHFTPGEQEQFIQLMAKLADALEEEVRTGESL